MHHLEMSGNVKKAKWQIDGVFENVLIGVLIWTRNFWKVS